MEPALQAHWPSAMHYKQQFQRLYRQFYHLDLTDGFLPTSFPSPWTFLLHSASRFLAFVYLAGIQLLASHSWRSALAGGCGLLAGLAYQYNFLGLKRLKVPKPVMKWCSWAFGGLLGTSHPRQQALRPPQAGSSSQAAAPSQARQASAPALPAASPDAVQQLVAMGFDPSRAAVALQQSHNDVQTALTYLL
ncbi:MAG: hypothetical protein FRX49_09814 [Trebouxia sp. A1-2]|nr:MAG: hypothetical protein FRX49_09814 [Trebouxia sp. A1-2]